MTNEQPQGKFLGMPMNWEFDLRKMARNYWNSEDERVFPPKVWGIGWDINGHALMRRLGVIPPGPSRKEE